MPVNKKDYPSNWPELTREVKAASGWRCEWCNAPHKAVIRRKSPHDPADWTAIEKVYNKPSIPFQIDLRRRWESTANMSWARLRYHGLTRIILTTAHLDRNTKNNARENLAALCQRCHLQHDILQHIANRRYGRGHAREHQLRLEF